MTHAELFQDVHGRYRWLAVEEKSDGVAATVSQQSFATAEEAYADACSLPLTILADVRESPTTRQVSYEEAVALLRKDDDLFE